MWFHWLLSERVFLHQRAEAFFYLIKNITVICAMNLKVFNFS